MINIQNPFTAYIGTPDLNLSVSGGLILINGTSTTVAATTILLAANTTTFVYLTAAGVVQSNTTAVPIGSYPIASVVTDNQKITTINDKRPDVEFAPGESLGVAPVSLTAQSAAISTTTLYTVPGASTTFSMFRLFAYVVLTQADNVSESIGPLVITFNDGTGAKSVNIGVGAVSSFTGVGSSTAMTGNTPGNANSVFAGILPFMAQGGTNITYSMAYTSGGTPHAQYTIQLRLDLF